VRREESRRRRAEAAGRQPGPPPDVEEAATALIMAERVRLAVDALPDDQRVAVQLAYFGGRTYRQVADDLGLAEGTAKARLRMGLRRLARELETEGIREWA
jgi:RNA polymerase sigma-70 factor (ECF subfamily)